MASAESEALTQRALEGAKSVIQKTSPPKRGEVDDASMALLVLIMRNYGRLHMSSADDADSPHMFDIIRPPYSKAAVSVMADVHTENREMVNAKRRPWWLASSS